MLTSSTLDYWDICWSERKKEYHQDGNLVDRDLVSLLIDHEFEK